MKRARLIIKLSLLAVATLLCVATSAPDPVVIEVDATWVAANVYEGQTAFPRHGTIELSVGTRDLYSDNAPEEALRSVVLRRAEDNAIIDFDVEVGNASSTITPLGQLARDTDYVLDLSGLNGYLETRRFFPGTVNFSTRSAPRVLDIWRNADTLIIEFSEPMDPETLYPGHLSVDVMWQNGSELVSIAADRNPANYAWETDGALFMIASIAEVGEMPEVWVKVSGQVTALTGVRLDGNNNGVPGETLDDYLAEVVPGALLSCHTREDIPAPCVADSEIPEDWWW